MDGNKPPKIVSLVPSWTETLIAAGVPVVGRTRYCIHPKEKVESIPMLGGTKSVQWERLKEKPDLVLFDKEENKKEMAEACPFPYYATHIRSILDLPKELKSLSEQLNSPKLLEYAERWNDVIERPSTAISINQNEKKFPGLIRWFREPSEEIQEIAYFVWRKPWMILQKDTFIGSVLEHIGFQLTPYPSERKYPEVELEWLLKRPGIAFLFSSEPYPFEDREEELKDYDPPCALVDGEAFGWFGVRSLEFLESSIQSSSKT